MRLAVVGDQSVSDSFSVSDVTVLPPEERDGADAVVAVGEAALREAAFDPDVDAPILPLDCGAPWSPGRHAAADAFASLLAGEYCVVDHPVLSVHVAGELAGRALQDAMLITSEPAHISGFGVSERPPGTAFSPDGPVETPAWRPIDEFRADGVVVATPLGSRGYARAAGGSVLGSGAGLAVVPVSPYATRTDSWVLVPPLRLTVERDDAPVSLVLDDAVACDVTPSDPVDVSFDGSVPLLLD